jgi:hypothetical protein
MKGFLGCCYQRDVPPETIQNFCGLGCLDISDYIIGRDVID